MGEDRKFLVVVWGATGFTGKLVAEYLSKKTSLSWAIAGRSKEKLEQVRESLSDVKSAPEILVCDLNDKTGLERVVGSTKVMLSTAGPFAKVGTPVVEACIEKGTDYVDITGEVAWVRTMIDKYESSALSKNVILCSCCGFDSAPSDLGVLYGINKLREKYGSNTKVGRVSNFAVLRGGVSGGTLASGILMEKDPIFSKMMKDPFLLGGKPAGGAIDFDKDFTGVAHEKDLNVWLAPFGMATINTRIVRRSGMIANYGEGFGYRETSMAPSEEIAQKLAQGGPPAEKREKMVEQGRLPKQGEGPSQELRAKSFFHMVFKVEAQDEPSKAVYVKVSGGEPGYDETSKMVAESALCLATQRSILPRKGGFLTPATAMGTHLIERFTANGITFEEIDPTDLARAVRPRTHVLARL